MKYISMYKNKGSWAPYYESDKKIMNKYSDGELELFKICDKKDRRKYQFHKKVFALLQFIFENNREKWKSLEQTRGNVLLQIGHVKIFEKSFKGKIEKIEIPASIAFENLGQRDFEQLYERMLDWASEYFSMSEDKIAIELANFM